MMKKHYLLFASLAYAYPILRPLEAEIQRRGGEVAWYLEPSCADLLTEDERRLMTFAEVAAFNPVAVFAPGNHIYDFFPGVKVSVFHGYPIQKRPEKNDDHFTLRGWFDVYCTQGESSTAPFMALAKKHRYFKVYETGWCRVDEFFAPGAVQTLPDKGHKTILYASTFTRRLSSAWVMPSVIRRLAASRDWHWILTLHPKIDDPLLLQQYEDLARQYPTVEFRRFGDHAQAFRESDVLLCDSSSIIVEYMMLDKPVVTFRNTHPGDHLVDVQRLDDIESAIDKALTRPAALMESIRRFTARHEAHRDGQNSARVLDAVDDFIAHYQGKLPPKPLNLFRKLKLRWQLRHFAPIHLR